MTADITGHTALCVERICLRCTMVGKYVLGEHHWTCLHFIILGRRNRKVEIPWETGTAHPVGPGFPASSQ